MPISGGTNFQEKSYTDITAMMGDLDNMLNLGWTLVSFYQSTSTIIAVFRRTQLLIV